MGISFSKRILFGASAVVIVIVAFLAGQNSNNSSSPSPSPVSDKSIDTDATTGVQNPSDGQVERAVSVGASPVVEGDTLFSETTTDLGQSISNNKLWWPQDTALTTTGKFVQVDLKMIDQAFGPESIAVSVSGLYDQAGRAYAYQNDYSDCGT